MNGGVGAIFLLLFGFMLYGLYDRKQKQVKAAQEEAASLRDRRPRRQSWVDDEDEPTNADLLAEIRKLNQRIKTLENKE